MLKIWKSSRKFIGISNLYLEKVLFHIKIYISSNENFPVLIEHPEVLKIAKNHNKSAGQVLLRFVYQSGFIVLPKSSNPSRIKSNFEIQDFELTKQDIEELKKLDQGERGRVFDFVNVFLG